MSTFCRPERREHQGKCCPLARLAVDRDGAIMFLDDAVADREAEAGPFAGWFGREKRLENLVPDFSRHAGPVVNDFNLDIVIASGS